MTTSNWRDEWDSAAEDEHSRYDALPVPALLERVRKGDFGDYYSIWYSIAKRATVNQAAWILFDVLQSSAPYLIRYRAAKTLIDLLRCADIEPVSLSAERFPLKENLAKLRERILVEVGSPDSNSISK